ncbi:MAG: hypothetical protein GXO76_04395 [Calditrichaeota bacterium]|nr:hypothetical protein [Calditrichota bacterium]
MRLTSIGLLLTGFLLLASCQQSTKEPLLPSIPAGSFHYTGFDSTGRTVVTGWLSFSFTDSIRISGKWNLQKNGSIPRLGPQTGSGILSGRVQNGKISINLNPNQIDNNVDLFGEYHPQRFSGKWVYSGYPGILNSGTFQAVRK